mgnify:CR=1 FL=1
MFTNYLSNLEENEKPIQYAASISNKNVIKKKTHFLCVGYLHQAFNQYIHIFNEFRW